MEAKETSTQERYVLVVTCVVLREDPVNGLQALILKRSEKESEGPGLWTVPGGKITKSDWGEPCYTINGHAVWRSVLSRAVARELFEETGIEVSPESFTFLQDGDLVFMRKEGIPTLVTTFSLFFEGNPMEIRLDQDSVGYRWVSKEELGGYVLIGLLEKQINAVFGEYAKTTVMHPQ